MRAFAEADKASQFFEYYLLDTRGFQPNIFTAIIPGINDGAIPTAANAANGQRPTIGAVRVVLEPKPGLPTDPEDVEAFIDIFTDISGLFVINNESGWYEGWMIHDLVVPDVAPPRLGRPRNSVPCRAQTPPLLPRGASITMSGQAVYDGRRRCPLPEQQ
jgi:hypothetical protein